MVVSVGREHVSEFSEMGVHDDETGVVNYGMNGHLDAPANSVSYLNATSSEGQYCECGHRAIADHQ
jgi:hypothetical protein